MTDDLSSEKKPSGDTTKLPMSSSPSIVPNDTKTTSHNDNDNNEEEHNHEEEEQKSNNSPKQKGIWVGIDLGTTNCACAVWDSNRSRSKLLRLRSHDIALPITGSIKRGGKIVPSAVLFTKRGDEKIRTAEKEHVFQECHLVSSSSMKTNVVVGNAALQMLQQTFSSTTAKDDDDEEENKVYDTDDIAAAMVTSVKRIVGLTKKQCDVDFIHNLPFQTTSVITNKGAGAPKTNVINKNQTERDNSKSKEQEDDDEEEGIMIQVKPLQSSSSSSQKSNIISNYNKHKEETKDGNDDTITISPMQIASILLSSIKEAAEEYLSYNTSTSTHLPPHKRIHAPGMILGEQMKIENCVIGVPAHFGRTQRNSMIQAAKMAGFTGVVSTITESTAAAMAYGLHVSPPPTTTATTVKEEEEEEEDATANDSEKKTNQPKTPVRSVLVFDMGGGTADVTIAEMSFPTEHSASSSSSPRFKVIATAGDRKLGGDDMDEVLVTFVLNMLSQKSSSLSSSLTLTQGEKRRLYQECKRAKEELCNEEEGGGGTTTTTPSSHKNKEEEEKFAEVGFGKDTIEITKGDLEEAIAPLVLRAQNVVEDALDSYWRYHHQQKGEEEEDEETVKDDKNDVDDGKEKKAAASLIHEVVLVGGATRVPAIRKMLRSKFPPPIPPDLCCSVNAEAAVAQGCAIQAAFLSGLVPKHELRSALMLDALPHSIGVLVKKNNGKIAGGGDSGKIDEDDLFIPILEKDAPLPAMDYATFTLADVQQKGVTVIAVEDVGDDFPLQHLGEFTFLLHKLTEKELSKLESGTRSVDIGMTVEASGRFIVSIFDSNDPEHVWKKKRYQEQKKKRAAAKIMEQQHVLQQEHDNKKKEEEEDDDEGHEHSNDDEILKGKEEEVDDSMTMEQIYLTIICVIMFVLYVAARVAFSEPPTEESARII